MTSSCCAKTVTLAGAQHLSSPRSDESDHAALGATLGSSPRSSIDTLAAGASGAGIPATVGALFSLFDACAPTVNGYWAATGGRRHARAGDGRGDDPAPAGATDVCPRRCTWAADHRSSSRLLRGAPRRLCACAQECRSRAVLLRDGWWWAVGRRLTAAVRAQLPPRGCHPSGAPA